MTNNSYTVSSRPRLPIDAVDGDGTVLDVMKTKPSYKYSTFKKVSRQIQDAEVLKQFAESKGVLAPDKEFLEKLFGIEEK